MQDKDRNIEKGVSGGAGETTGRPDGKAEPREDMEIAVNGKQGPTIRFRIGAMAIVNGLILLIGFSITFSILRADVETLKAESKQNASQVHVVVEELRVIKNSLEYTREDIRFLRDELAQREVLRGRERGGQSGGRNNDGKR